MFEKEQNLEELLMYLARKKGELTFKGIELARWHVEGEKWYGWEKVQER